MATFVFGSSKNYIEDSPVFLTLPGVSDTDGTLTDDGGDDYFTFGETITSSDGFSGTFLGTLSSVNGPLVVIQNSSGNVRIFSSADESVSGSTFPDPFVSSNATPFFTVCFAAGTYIATPSGEKPVERLSIGELVCTSDHRAVPVKWVGRQTIAKVFAGERACLVRIEAGALGNHSDLYVTGDHGMVLDGYVVNASALVNGDNIDWVPYSETPERQTVYHVETTDHEIILANGAASETYVDVTGRQTFDNHQDYLDLYGAERTIAEMERPRISAQRLVPEAIKRKIGIVEKAIPGSTTDFSISHSSRATARTGA